MIPAALPFEHITSATDIPPGTYYTALGDACFFDGIPLDLLIFSELQKDIVFFDISEKKRFV